MLSTGASEPRADSRVFAAHLGNKHKNTMELVSKHLTELEAMEAGRDSRDGFERMKQALGTLKGVLALEVAQ